MNLYKTRQPSKTLIIFVSNILYILFAMKLKIKNNSYSSLLFARVMHCGNKKFGILFEEILSLRYSNNIDTGE